MVVGWKKTVSELFPVPQRFILGIMGSLSIVCVYTTRIGMSVAITAMVKAHEINSSSAEVADRCPETDGSGEIIDSDNYDWDERLQGIILSAFYFGYVITQVPGGYLADKFGGKHVLGLGVLFTCALSLLTPIVVEGGGSTGLIILRALQGLCQGITYPALNALLAVWIPLKERSKYGSLVYGGSQVGTILGTSLASVLLSRFGTWHAIFYCFGTIGVVWFILFTFLCSNDPDSHPFIKEEELVYLKKEIGSLKRYTRHHTIPWKEIVTSAPVLAMIAAEIGHGFSFYVMVSDLPKYLADVLRFSPRELGVISSLPFVCMWIVCLISGILCDWLIATKRMSNSAARKWFTGVGAVGPAIFLIAASYAGCDRKLVVTLFMLGMACMGCYYAGVIVNGLDLSPNFAGSLMALQNGFSAMTGIAAPFFVGVLTPDRTLVQWRIVFWVAFSIFIASAVIYTVWAEGEVQPWNEMHQEVDDKEKENS